MKNKKNTQKEFESFRDWNKDFLNMNLKKRTSILEISYRDSDKELIIPALNKIAKAYQNILVNLKKKY